MATPTESVVQPEVQENNVNNQITDDKKKDKKKIILLVTIIVILVIVAIVEVIYLTNKKDDKVVEVEETTTTTEETTESTPVTTTTTEASVSTSNDSIVVYKQDRDRDEKTYLYIDYLSNYKEHPVWWGSAGGSKDTREIIYTYECIGDCIIIDNNDYTYDYANDGILYNEYVYDNGKIIKTDKESDFKEINVTLSTVEIKKYDAKLIYFEDDNKFIKLETKLDGTILNNDSIDESRRYKQSMTDNSFFYNSRLLENGYVVITTSDGTPTVYDYKNDKIISSGSDDMFSTYIIEYDNFIVIEGLGIMTYDAKFIYSDNNFYIEDSYNDFYSITENYAYIINGSHIDTYNINGELVRSTKEYNKAYQVVDKYAIVVDDNYYKIVDVTNDDIIVSYDVKYTGKYDYAYGTYSDSNNIYFYISQGSCEDEHAGDDDALAVFSYDLDAKVSNVDYRQGEVCS